MDRMQRKPRRPVVTPSKTPVRESAFGRTIHWRWPQSSWGFLETKWWRSKVVVLCVAVIGMTSAYTILTYSPDTASAAAQGDGLIVYGASGNTTPQVRTHSNASNNFSAAGGTVAGGVPSVVVNRTSPNRMEAVTGYVDSGGTLRVMCYDGSSWTNEWNVNVGGNGSTRRFDIAYETNSGDVVVLYSANTATTNELVYRTRPGSTSCGAGNWSGATNLNPIRTSGIVHWVKVAWDKRSSSNLITAIWADANRDLSAMQWDGSAWGNEHTSALETSLEVRTSGQDLEDFDVVYESSSGDVMVAWSNDNGSTQAKYKNCTGGTATCSWGTTADIIAAASGGTNISLASNPNNDEIVVGTIDGFGVTDLYIRYWSGSAWSGSTAVYDGSVIVPAAGNKLIAAGWLVSGGTTRSVVVYNDCTFCNTSASNIGWYVGSGNTFTKQTDFAPTPAFGTPQDSYDIQMDPFNKDRLMFTVSDNNNDLFAKRLVMTSTPGFTWSNSDGSAALDTNLAQTTVGDFSFAYWRTPPSYDQKAYRWYNNADSVQPGSALANEDTPASLKDRTAPVRLRMGTTNVGTDLVASSQAFKLQYATSTGGPWTDVASPPTPWCNTSSPVTCNTSWQYRKRITFDNTASGSTLSNFPVMVDLSTSNFDFSKARADGFDVVFTDSSGTALNFEREKYDGSSEGIFWVNVPSIPNNAATFINMYYGNAAAASDPVTTAVMNNTWNSTFEGVWHLRETPSAAAQDSTVNNYDAAVSNMEAGDQTAGQIDGSLNFGGTNEFANGGHQTNLYSTSNTFGCWIKPSAAGGGNRDPFGDVNTAGTYGSFFLQVQNTNIPLAATLNNGTNTVATATTVLSSTQWSYVAATRTGNTTTIYVNGVSEGSATTAGSFPSFANVGSLGIGRPGGTYNGEHFVGGIDECRYSSTNRSADWIKAEYLSNTDAFNTLGGEEDQVPDTGWKYYDNATPVDGAQVTTNLLAASTAADRESYTESNPTASNLTAIATGETGEWDFSLDASTLCGGTYYFRMVKSDGTAFVSYANYAQITLDIIAPTDQVMRHGGWFNAEIKRPYNCEWVAG